MTVLRCHPLTLDNDYQSMDKCELITRHPHTQIELKGVATRYINKSGAKVQSITEVTC